MILLTLVSTDSDVSADIKAVSVRCLNCQAAAVGIVLYLVQGKPWSIVLLITTGLV